MNTNNQIVTQKKLLGWYSDTPPFLATVESEKGFFLPQKGGITLQPASWKGESPFRTKKSGVQVLQKK